MGSGVNITLDNVTTTTSLVNATSNSTISTETITTSKQITLLNPVWQLVHFMIGAILIVFVIMQILTMMGIQVSNNKN